jgi:DNA polymerase-3 subunit delta
VRRFEGMQARATEILEAQRNLSLLDPVAAVVVRQAARLAKSECEVLHDALRESGESEDAGPPLVLWDATLDRRNALFASVTRAGAEVEFRAFWPREAVRWVEGEARRLGHRITSTAAEVLVESVGSDLRRLRRSLEVLSLHVDSGRPIDERSVLEVIPAARSHAPYEIQDALSTRDGARAVRLLREALEEGQEPPLLVGALFAELRRLQLARGVPPGTDARGAAEMVGTSPGRAERLVQNARRFPVAVLRDAVGRLADIDVASKTGRGDPGTALEEWIVALCGSSG